MLPKLEQQLKDWVPSALCLACSPALTTKHLSHVNHLLYIYVAGTFLPQVGSVFNPQHCSINKQSPQKLKTLFSFLIDTQLKSHPSPALREGTF